MRTGFVVSSQTSDDLAERHILMGQRGAVPVEDDAVALFQVECPHLESNLRMKEVVSDACQDLLADYAMADKEDGLLGGHPQEFHGSNSTMSQKMLSVVRVLIEIIRSMPDYFIEHLPDVG